MTNEDFFHELKTSREKAWIALYSLFREELFWYCFRQTRNKPLSEEIANDCIEKASERREQFSDKDHVSKFLFRCARNACTDDFRKTGKQRKLRQELQNNHDEYEAQEFNDAETERLTLLQKVLKALQELPAQQQKAYRLYYIDKMDYEDIAKIMGVARQTAYNLVSKALMRLRKRCGDQIFFDQAP